MTAKEYLSQIGTISAGLKSMSRQIQSLEDALTSTTTKLSDAPPSASPEKQRMEALIVTKVDLESKVAADSAKLAGILVTVNSLPDMFHSIILVNRYVALMDWQDIANELRLSKSHIFRLHRQALAEIEKVIADGSI
jgi:DNA-directed RNA polymerase specialized sigma subunit